MAWQANGAYYSFREDMIRLHAPPVSGVYGLYNFRHQILIGASEDIRNALLRHLQKTNFRFRRFAPTGFVFELCPPEDRASRAEELIREYKPILQMSRPFSALWRSWRVPRAVAFYPHGVTAHRPEASGTKTRESLKRVRFDRERFALVASGFGAILLAIGFIALLLNLKDDSSLSWPTASVEEIVPSHTGEIQVASLTRAQAASARDASTQEAEIIVPPDRPVAAPQATITPEQPEIFIASESTDRDSAGHQIKAAFSPAQPSTDKARGREGERNGWTVQAVATTSKVIAVDWLDKLKAKNYSAFVAKAEINGQTWYRVRVGHFQIKAEAESLRATLQTEEGFHDAFIAASTKSEPLAALSVK